MQFDALAKAGIAHQICGDETLFDLYFTDRACVDYRAASHDNPAVNAAYNAALRDHGVFKSPAKLYPSLAITEEDIALTQAAVEKGVEAITAL